MNDLSSAERTLAGLMWALGAVFLANILLTLPRIAGGELATVQVVFVRYLAGTLIITPVFLARMLRGDDRGDDANGDDRRTRWLHALRAVMAVSRICCFVYAVTHMPFANAQAVSLTNGVFMMIFGALILKERINAVTAIAAAVSFAGAVIAAEPSADAALFVSPGAIAALAGAAIWGLESTVIRYTALRDRTDRILFYVNAVALVLAAGPAAWFWTEMSGAQWLTLMAMGPIALMTQVTNIWAFRAARASILAPVRYMAIVFALLLGLVLFGEWPSASAAFGMALVAAGGLMLTMLAASGTLRATWLRP